MVVDRAISRRAGPVVEVPRPADQHTVDSLPRVFIAPAQDCADPRLEPCDALLRRAGPEIPPAVLREIVGSEAVAEEVETLLACITQAGLRLVELEPQTAHDLCRPRLRLRRATAAEDDEVVCVVDHMRLELAPLLGQPPVLEKAVHVDVGEQW